MAKSHKEFGTSTGMKFNPKVVEHNQKRAAQHNPKEWGKQAAQDSVRKLGAKSLPSAPRREQFKTKEEFEEAMSFYHSRIGKLQKMAGVTKTARSSDSRDE